MILGRSNWFQLFTRRVADFQLAVNRTRMDATEIHLWHNIEIMRKVIEEAGLEDKLEQEYQKAVENYSQNENERYERHRAQVDEDRQTTREMTRNLFEVLSNKKPSDS
jgi:hypothetical protein